MAYQNNIPQPTDKLKDSQSDLLNNFMGIYTLVNQDHVIFDAVGEGKHKQVSLPVQNPAPVFAAGEVGLFSFLNPQTNQNELYLNKTNQVTVTQIPASASTLSITSAPASGTGFWTYLPSGLLLKSSTGTGLTGLIITNTSAALPTSPPYNQILSVIVCPHSAATGDDNFSVRFVDIQGATNFRVYISSRTAAGAGTGGYQWLTIGY